MGEEEEDLGEGRGGGRPSPVFYYGRLIEGGGGGCAPSCLATKMGAASGLIFLAVIWSNAPTFLLCQAGAMYKYKGACNRGTVHLGTMYLPGLLDPLTRCCCCCLRRASPSPGKRNRLA